MLISRLILEWVAKPYPNIVLYLQTVGVFRAGFSYDDLVVYATTVDGFTAVWTDYVGESKHGAADAILWFSANFWFAALLRLRVPWGNLKDQCK